MTGRLERRRLKIFVSWSGEASKAAAEALAGAVREVLDSVEPWISASDIEPGQQWFSELMGALEGARFAVVCLTSRTLRAPWLLFEAGAVAAKFGATKVVPVLLDCQARDLVDPLARFQAIGFDRSSARRLFESINEIVESRLTPRTPGAAFDADARARPAKPKYDVFLSGPMAPLPTDAAYTAFHADAMKVVAALRDQASGHPSRGWAVRRRAGRRGHSRSSASSSARRHSS